MYFLNIYIENSDEHEAQFDECFQDDNTTANSADSTCKPPPPKKRKLPKAFAVSGEKKTRRGGKMMYFGIKGAILGDSPGLLSQHGHLLQYLIIYKSNKTLLPNDIRKKVPYYINVLLFQVISKRYYLLFQLDKLDIEKEIEEAKAQLRSEVITMMEQEGEEMDPDNLPEFLIDINIDGVQLFKNSEQAELIPILAIIHSVRKAGKETIFKSSTPILLGYYHGQGKPNVKKFLAPLLADLESLHKHNPNAPKDRQFTVKLRCIRTDAPMRAYLKRIKHHSGFWACERCIQKGEQCIVKLMTKNLQVVEKSKKRTEEEDDYAAESDGEIEKDPKKKKKKVLIEKKIIQLRDLNAAPRTDANFYNYFPKFKGDDEHVKATDVSPFKQINFPMVTGFSLDSMHTMLGTVKRALEGIVFFKHEGKLPTEKLKVLDRRLDIFKLCKPLEFDRYVRNLTTSVSSYKDHEIRQFLYYLLYPVFNGILSKEKLDTLLLLQQSMLLMGSYNPKPVQKEDNNEARRLLKSYVKALIEFGYPIRYLTHLIIHLPEDVENHQTGIELLSAFVFENVQRIFRYILSCGSKPCEQIRNRLMERQKYVLPTAADGLIVSTGKEFEKLAELQRKKEAGSQLFLLEFIDRGEKFPKILRFANFTITTEFPNNICLLKNGKVFACTNVERDFRTDSLIIYGNYFSKCDRVYSTPFSSLKYHIQIVSKLSADFTELNINNIRGKMYLLPLAPDKEELSELPTLCDQSVKWYASPLFHTLY